ncbi:MAG: cell division protein FtsQ/DivIB [Candidatus Omnitrophica bacterium]|nr:cell division protein FtsQ/DivIB [Candidatus Omnitrophota bacterium]
MKKKNNAKNKKIMPKKPQGKGFYKILITVLPICVLTLALLAFFRNSDYFRIAEIEMIDSESGAGISAGDLLKMYKGRNIFEVDINMLASRIKTENPFIKYAIVKRVLPNRLEISVVERIPVALVKAREDYPVDADGMVLPSEVGDKQLIAISGVHSWAIPEAGRKIVDRNLRTALALVKLFKEKSITDVRSIDTSDRRNAIFQLKNGVEIKIGNEDFDPRLDMLKATLSRKGLDFENIRYIDLRFKDVVIKPR